MSMSGTFAEQLRPSLFLRMNIKSLSSAGTSLPGGVTEILTPTAVYLKWPNLTQTMHLTKPWVVIPFSAGKSGGMNFSQLVNQASGSSPLTQAQMFDGATSVSRVGTGTVDGIPVTEYTGTIPVGQALSSLPGSTAKTQLRQAMATLGFTKEKFTAWIDGQHQLRKASITMAGKVMTEKLNMTITSINQPVNTTVPPPSQTSPLPASQS